MELLIKKACTLLKECKYVTLAIESEGSFPVSRIFRKKSSKAFNDIDIVNGNAETPEKSGKAKLCYSNGNDAVILIGNFDRESMNFVGDEVELYIDGDFACCKLDNACF